MGMVVMWEAVCTKSSKQNSNQPAANQYHPQQKQKEDFEGLEKNI